MTQAQFSRPLPTRVPPVAVVDKHCVFRCGGCWFSMLATSVRELTMAPRWVCVPGSDAALVGLCHVRNEFIPAVSLLALLGESEGSRADSRKLLVIAGSAGNWALLIDDVVALEPLETLTTPEARTVDHRQAAVLGTATFRDQVVRVLDPHSLYRRAEQRLRTGWHGSLDPVQHAPDAQGDAR